MLLANSNLDRILFSEVRLEEDWLPALIEFQLADFNTVYITINFLGVIAYLVSLFLLQESV
jgi:hypothetical protein